ncbi:cell division cycle-associated protein 2 isoform X2 [Boleophthalmus pectinirostris]|uniref:cell division cycle-associated protein 2 isoform X2 n=1 Tax=Boleophthalmus pectinirostris TaxID=150288 RepID=UPI00242A8464|nr:cell division cycle-associated protein 2 isoform X2 [Boleophthalmus pectinirostris]
MSTIEMSSTAPEEEQQGSTTVLADLSIPINFSETTAADFGISVQSFIPASQPSSNRKEKSRLAQLKERRRSNIGVRGSPETNSLIRFIAQQRMKTPPTQATPELVRQSPFLPLVASTLRQKMACFQSLMGMEENGDSSSGGCITTRDDLCDGKNLEAGKENHPPSIALPPNKKRRLGLSHGCEGEITEDSHPPLLFKQLEEEDSSVKHRSLQSDKSEGPPAQALVISPPFTEGELPVSPDAQLWPPVENQQEVVFELERIHQPRPDDPSAVSAELPVSHFTSPSISSLLEMKPSDSLSSPTLRKKKKQVRFGEPLPPELFDKTLPPSTPLQKGGTPARVPTPGGALKLRSLLKTPQRGDSPSTRAQLELSSPSVFASPTLSMPRSRRTATSEDDEEEMSGMIPFPIEEIEKEAAIAEESLNAQLPNLDTAFNEDSISHTETECETKAVETVCLMDSLPHEPLQEEEPQTDIAAPACGTSNSRRRGGKASHDTTEASARSSGRKRKLPEESEPVKRSSRSAAKTASGKMKASTATRRWNKKVDRSLYGSREYASKNPSLSPITERLSLGLSFSAEEPPALHHTAPSLTPHPDLRCNGKSVSGDLPTAVVPQTGDTTALNTSTTPQVSLSLPVANKKNSAQRTRRRSGSKGTGRALKGIKVSVNDDQADARVHDRSEENYAEQEETEETKRTETVFKSTGDARSDISAMNLLDAPTAMNEKSESPTILEATTGFSAGEEFKHALGEVEPGQENEPDDQMNHEVERGQGDQTLSQRETTRSRSDEHEAEEEAGAASALSLPPWQDDFNFEDVFKPVPTRGQRSVRRSLRNQSSADHISSGGLAWVPRISPESTKESRRRTRGRRHSAALPAPAFEVTQA